MLITVTAEDIARGVPGSLMQCPLARAIKRATRRKDVQVWHYGVAIGPQFQTRRRLPLEAALFIARFDAYGSSCPMQPFNFDLDL